MLFGRMDFFSQEESAIPRGLFPSPCHVADKVSRCLWQGTTRESSKGAAEPVVGLLQAPEGFGEMHKMKESLCTNSQMC